MFLLSPTYDWGKLLWQGMFYCLLTSDMIKYKMLDSNTKTNKDFNVSDYIVEYKINGGFESRIKFEHCQKGHFTLQNEGSHSTKKSSNATCRNLAYSLCIKVIVTSLA